MPRPLFPPPPPPPQEETLFITLYSRLFYNFFPVLPLFLPSPVTTIHYSHSVRSEKGGMECRCCHASSLLHPPPQEISLLWRRWWGKEGRRRKGRGGSKKTFFFRRRVKRGFPLLLLPFPCFAVWLAPPLPPSAHISTLGQRREK